MWTNDGEIPLIGRTNVRVIGKYYAGDTCQLGIVPTIPGLVGCPTDTEPAQTTTHPDQHGAAWLPDGRGGVTLMVANDGGAFTQHVDADDELSNGGWGDGANDGLNTLSPYDLAVAKDGTVTAGLQDNGQMKITPSGRQSMIFGGDAFYSAIDPDDPKVIYEEYVGGVMTVTTDGGITWRSMNPMVTSGQFSTPFEMDRTNAKHLVVAGRDVKETDAGPATSSADQTDVTDTPLTGAGFDPTAPQWATVFDLGTGTGGNDNSTTAIDTRGDATYVGFCGACDVLAQKSPFQSGLATNVGGDAPQRQMTGDGWHVAKAAGLPNRLVTSVTIDPRDPRTVYVTLGGYSRPWLPPAAFGLPSGNVGKGHVFRSTNAGESFTDVSANLPDAPANDVWFHSGQLVVATEIGMFISANSTGGRYSQLGTGLPAAPVLSVEPDPADSGRVLIAAYGRGIWDYRYCTDSSRPTARVFGLARRRGGGITLRGTARDRGCEGARVARVDVALARRVRGLCSFLSSRGRLAKPRKCSRPRYIRARGSSSWSLRTRSLPSGAYIARVRPTDRAGNRGRPTLARFRVR